MRYFRHFAAAVAALALFGCAPKAEGPALWRLSDADSEIWLFGTVHVLKPDVKWRTARIDDALRSADLLYFETPTDDAATAEVARLASALGANPEGVTLSSLLSPQEKARFERVSRALGVEPAALDEARPWLAALQLSVAMLVRQGADPEAGVENVLEAEAARLAKKTAYFETASEQMHFLADLSPAAEKQFFIATLRQIEEESDQSDVMDTLWARGDAAKLGALLTRMTDEAGPEAANALIYTRNATWAEKVDTMMQGKGRIFIAVGAAHLTGPRGVPALLRAKGYTVEGP